MYPEGETETFYIVLFGSSTSTKNSIGELQMDAGKYRTRVPSESANGASEDIAAAGNFDEGTSVDVVLTWSLSEDGNNRTYTIELPGTETGWQNTWTAFNTNYDDVQTIQMKLSGNSATANFAVEVDNLVISERNDDGSYTPVWSDDFDSYDIDRDLVADPYNDNGHSAVVAEGSLQ
jgi:hypothetical protein